MVIVSDKGSPEQEESIAVTGLKVGAGVGALALIFRYGYKIAREDEYSTSSIQQEPEPSSGCNCNAAGYGIGAGGVIGLYAAIIDDIQCSLSDCFIPDFLEVTQKCQDNCLNHCYLQAEENLVMYLILLLIIIFVLAGIVFYFESLLKPNAYRRDYLI